MPIVGVVIDSREAPWVKALTFGGVAVSVDLIDTDVLVLLDDGTIIGIEHKESSDLLIKLREE